MLLSVTSDFSLCCLNSDLPTHYHHSADSFSCVDLSFCSSSVVLVLPSLIPFLFLFSVFCSLTINLFDFLFDCDVQPREPLQPPHYPGIFFTSSYSVSSIHLNSHVPKFYISNHLIFGRSLVLFGVFSSFLLP